MEAHASIDLTRTWAGYTAIAIFASAYIFVILEEITEMRKSKPVLLAAGLIWALIGAAAVGPGQTDAIQFHSKAIIEEYAELFLFLVVAITYVNTMEERRLFDALRDRLAGLGWSYVRLYWLLGSLAFALSGALDNLTTALVMGAVAIAVGRSAPKFAILACINIVVAANAGGAFSPFGDITTLMVWQSGKLTFWEFFALFMPSLVNWIVPAIIMSFAVPKGIPMPAANRAVAKAGAAGVIILFALTIVTAVSFKNLLHMPPALGMMLGLGYLQIYAFFLQKRGARRSDQEIVLDSFAQIQRVEWDTLLFFFGIIFAVGGLGVIGYVGLAANSVYGLLSYSGANAVIGALSAVIDNIPLMYAVLSANVDMPKEQWLLITLTCGVGGSLLSIGSAAGVALMGLAQDRYTFGSHLKWSWAIALGYVASIAAHLIVNR